MSFLPMKTPNPLLPPKSPLENGYDMLRWLLGMGPPQGTGFPTMPQQPEDRPLFQGLLYEPPKGKGLLNIPDPDAGPRPFPGGNASAPPAPSAWGAAPSYANPAPQFSPSDLRAVTALLSNSALPAPRIAPEPHERDAPLAAQSNPYAPGGLGSGVGSDWRNEFSVFALDQPRSPFGSMQPPATRPIDEDLLDVPAYKRGFFRDRDQAQNWRYLNQGIDRMRNTGANEKFAIREIVAAEGGGVPDASDPEAKGPAIAGITAKTLESLKIPGVEPGTLPADLKPWQWGGVYRAYFHREFRKADGYKTLEQIKHPGVSAFVADTSFRAGQPGFALVQQAINTVRKEQGLPTIAEDKIFGSETLDAVNQVSSTRAGRRAFGQELKRLRDIAYPDDDWRTAHFLELL